MTAGNPAELEKLIHQVFSDHGTGGGTTAAMVKLSVMQPEDGENIPAICGAFMFCRLSAVRSELPALFDESFFMYKEDIELCLRLSAKGWKMHYSPQVRAFHCRGWKDNRRKISRNLKLMSAENEIKMYQKHPSFYMIWARLKYILVRYLNV